MNLRIQRLMQHAILPSRATSGSAGLDLYACLEEPLVIEPHQITMVPTGLACEPTQNDVILLIFARSGLACKHGIALANGVGVIDADYRGELKVALVNQSDVPFTVTHGMRIAQLVETNVMYPHVIEVASLAQTDRGVGGFGSTGL